VPFMLVHAAKKGQKTNLKCRQIHTTEHNPEEANNAKNKTNWV